MADYSRNVSIQLVQNPDMFIHYDPRHQVYIAGTGDRGACVFEAGRARDFLASMRGSERHRWRIVASTGDIPSAVKPADLYKELYRTPTYKKVRGASGTLGGRGGAGA